MFRYIYENRSDFFMLVIVFYFLTKSLAMFEPLKSQPDIVNVLYLAQCFFALFVIVAFLVGRMRK